MNHKKYPTDCRSKRALSIAMALLNSTTAVAPLTVAPLAAVRTAADGRPDQPGVADELMSLLNRGGQLGDWLFFSTAHADAHLINITRDITANDRDAFSITEDNMTVTNGVTISNQGGTIGDAIHADIGAGSYFSNLKITNGGTILGAVNGVNIVSEFRGGTVINLGTISGGNVGFQTTTFSGGTVSNSEVISAASGAGFQADIFSRGNLTNSGTISGGNVGFQATTFSGGTVSNAGLISAASGAGFQADTFSDGTVINSGTIIGASNGFQATTFNGGRVDNSGTIIGRSGAAMVLASQGSGGTVTNSGTISSDNNCGVQISGGTSIGVVVDDGLVTGGGGYAGIEVTGGSTNTVTVNGGTVNGINISGATNIVNILGGTVSDVTVASSGMANVTSSGAVSGATVNSGGTANVSSGGKVSDAIVNSGGLLNLELGGTAVYTADATLSGAVAATGGTVWLASSSANRSLTLSQLNGSAQFVINTDLAHNRADQIIIGSGTSSNTIRVNYDPAFAGGRSVSGNAVFATVNGGSATFSARSTQYGAYTFTPMLQETTTGGVTSWAVTALTLSGASETMYTAFDAQAGMATQWRNETNHMMRRMGELRNAGGDAGEWVRVYGGQNKFSDSNGRDFNENYTAVQGGYDTRSRVQNGTLFRGYVLGYSDSDASYARGSGNGTSVTLGGYQSWLGDDGHFIDCIVKQGRLRSSYSDYLNNNSNTKVDGNYKSWGTSLSMEYGYRRQLAKEWYFEPQTEITASRITGTSYTASDGTTVNNKGINSLIGRLGVAVGRNIGKGTFYAEASILREFSAKTQLEMATGGLAAISMDQSLKDTWYEFALGWTAAFNKKTSSYFEISKATGKQMRTPWQLNVGVRWNF